MGVLIAIVLAVGLHSFSSEPKLGATISVVPQPTSETTLYTAIGGNSVNNGGIIDQGIRIPITAATLATASTSLCAIQSPTSTTTIVSFSLNITTASTSLVALVIGTTTTAFGTSSTPFVASQTVATNSLATIDFDPALNNGIVGPNQWVTVGTNGPPGSSLTAPAATFYSGTCNAVFRSVN